jgi:lipopolysaccharide/colanic/teichoic acid biosynthesis glycosyltransferase
LSGNVPRRRGGETAKVAIDRAVGVLALAAISPLLLVLAAIVRLDSPGPWLYRRRVLGLGGVPFDAFKLRTMRQDGDRMLAGRPELLAELQRNAKLRSDPRVTRSGHWMRRYSLDELPQLINVVAGQMSLVGPRMISPPELARYGAHSGELLSVRPGLTGLWQVSGRSDLAADERVRLDLEYVRNHSLWLDFRLVLRTIPALVKARGAF